MDAQEKGLAVEAASQLLNKARSLGVELPTDLERLALTRGCDYYERDLDPLPEQLRDVALTNAEIAIALISPELSPGPREIRLSAALISATDVQASEVADLALAEGNSDIIRYIARCGHSFEPANPFWEEILRRLPLTETDLDRMPHPTRFVEMTGIDRGKIGRFTRWIRPRRGSAA